MKSKTNWKLPLIILSGVFAIVILCIFGVQGYQNKAISLEEQVYTAQSDIKVQEKRRVDLVYNLVDCVKNYDKHESEYELKTTGAAFSGDFYTVRKMLDVIDDIIIEN